MISCIVLYRYFVVSDIILPKAASHASKIVELYTGQVWNSKHTNVDTLAGINTTQNNSIEHILNKPDVVSLARNTIQYFANTDFMNVVIYNGMGNEFIKVNQNNDIIQNKSTLAKYREGVMDVMHFILDRYFIDMFDAQDAMSKSSKNLASHTMLQDVKLSYDLYPHTLIVSTIPIISYAPNSPMSSMCSEEHYCVTGIIQIFSDVTSSVDKINRFEANAIVIIVMIFTIFCIVIIYNTNQAQRMLDKQMVYNRDLAAAKAQAESENFAKTEFLANVSHELRTPLNAIIGFSQIILSEAYGKLAHPQYLEYINDINNSGKHLLSVINDILDFSKASADKLKVTNVDLDLNKTASASMRFVKPRADEADVKLEEIYPAGHIVISADPKRLKQALLNLLSNSVKFTPRGGTVTLELVINEPDKSVDIIVKDTGIGMSDKDLPKALSSFGQVDNKLSRKYEGTGLGLPLTKKLVELMGGAFDIQSQPNVGTTVTLTFAYQEILS